VLLQAFKLLSVDRPALQLVLIASPKPGGDTEALISQLQLGDRIHFVGGVSHADIVRLYAESTVAVVPSLYEGFGLPAVEAMASGIPLVSSDGGALAEVVGDGGLLVPAGDAKALAEAIDAVLSDAGLAAELINRGQQRAHRTFSWSVCARLMVEQYQRCIDLC